MKTRHDGLVLFFPLSLSLLPPTPYLRSLARELAGGYRLLPFEPVFRRAADVSAPAASCRIYLLNRHVAALLLIPSLFSLFLFFRQYT